MTGISNSRGEHRARQGGHLVFCLAAVAVAIFAIGLVAPLTPSEGLPSMPTLAVFVGIPLALLAAAAYRARSTPGRVMCVALAAAIPVTSLCLLYVQR